MTKKKDRPVADFVGCLIAVPVAFVLYVLAGIYEFFKGNGRP